MVVMTATGPPQRATAPPPHIQVLEEQLAQAVSGHHRIDLLNELAWEIRRLDTKYSLELAEQAFAASTSSYYQGGLAASLLARGFAKVRLALYDEARRDAEEAHQLFEALDDPQGTSKALNVLGIVYAQLGDLSRALTTFLSIHMHCEALSDVKGSAAALNNVSLVYTYLGDYASALESYLKALHLYEEVKDTEGRARTLGNVSSTYYELGRFKEALESGERALELQGEWRDGNVHANLLMIVGQAHQALGNKEQALQYFLNSIEDFEACDDPLGMGHAQHKLGTFYLEQNDHARAEPHLLKSLELAQDVSDKLGIVKTSLALGQLWLKQARLDEAQTLLLKAFLAAKALGSKAELHKMHLILAELYEAQGNLPEALRHYKCHTRVKDKVFNETSNNKLQSLRVSFQVEQTEREREIYRLRNVELAMANEKLQSLNGDLKKLNQQKTRLVKQLKRLAQEDGLTKLFNRRYFDASMNTLFADQARPISIMLCDIDNFKTINDSFSHQMGDDVLCTVATLLRDGIQNHKDYTLARYGGEEFILAMPDTNLENARDMCEQLRSSIETFPWYKVNADLRVTMSLGLVVDSTVQEFERLVAQADAKLYEAKRQGKNRVCF